MVKLNVDNFSENAREYAPMQASVYLFECLPANEQEQVRKDWKEAGGRDYMPWWKWIMEHIEVAYKN